ncbi:hypothetical protein TUM20985_12040 [Mycobacterium antarcticum]|uniref:hypothetical protein n=1 Tax=unclassified Mycolicibacterium TaxID=2636767 RepID=UPI0023942A35|nr:MULTISPECIES: hypothetical protein [unclassified Mycolicibacterium]BDX30657.1 hypothetical protein TUM20985_12040 [Mycolicibacterium sp. TUM20985]GLP74020.1 hypothetical protein TUM20983_11300 [Mycolicibacterium sp. TUM20983]
MIGRDNAELSQPRTAMPTAAHGSINGMRLMLGILLFIIAVGAIMGVVVALSSGQWQVAMIVALVAGAFFARVGC